MKELDIKHVRIAPNTDGVDGLYINGKLFVSDGYYNGISAYIRGFLEGLHYMGWNGPFQTLSLDDDTDYAIDICEGEPLPKFLNRLPLEEMNKSVVGDYERTLYE